MQCDSYFIVASRHRDDFMPIDGVFPFAIGDAVGTMRQWTRAVELQKLFPGSRVSCWNVPPSRGPWSDVAVVGVCAEGEWTNPEAA